MDDYESMSNSYGSTSSTPAKLTTRIQHIRISSRESLRIRSLADHMQYADPLGHALSLGIGSAVWPLFGLLWPSSIQLARKLKNRPVREGESILELGCGLGLTSLMMHKRGANIHASDCHPMVPHFLRLNQALNGLSDLPYVHAQWGEQSCPDLLASLGLIPAKQRYDLIVGSDLLYEGNTPVQLAELVNQRAKAQAEVWLVDPDRGHRNKFTQEMGRYGFELVRQVCLRDQPIFTPEGKELPYKGRCLQYQRG